MIVDVNVARVFVDDKGHYGNPVGIVLNENSELNENQKQTIATKLNFSETVFIDGLGIKPVITIFNPKHKVTFAGHAVLGTAVFVNKVLKKDIASIKCGDKEVDIRKEGRVTYISAPLSIMPKWNLEQLNNPQDVERLSDDTVSRKKHTVVWAWINTSKGLIRARTFAPDWGIPEDQANGSGSILLAEKLNMGITIYHGEGSIIYAKPLGNEMSEVGGLVVMDKVRKINLLLKK